MAGEKILVVEDAIITAEDIRESLQDTGYVVIGVVSSGEEAIKKVEEENPDLVLMDIMLQGEMDGIETAKQIRSRFSVPVVYLTAYSDKKILERAKITEPFGYIIKPFNERELHINVEMALYKHKMESKLEIKLMEAYEKLYESEKYLRTIIDSSIDGITVVNEQGRFEFGNDSFFKIIEWPKEEIIGNYFMKIIPEDMAEYILKIWGNAREGVPNDFETKIVTKSGDFKYVKVAQTLTTINGENKVVSVSKDITENKKLELNLKESEAKFRELFENAQDAMYVVNPEGNFLKMNRVGLQILGCAEYEVIGSNISKWLTPKSLIITQERKRKRLSGESVNQTDVLELVCKNGEHRWVEIKTRDIKEGDRIIEIHGIARDITEKMRLQQELNKSNKQKKLLCYLIEGTRGGKTRALILRHLTEKSYNAHQLAKALNMDYKTIRHHLEVLVKHGIITRDNDGYTDLYFLSKNLELDFHEFDQEHQHNKSK